MEQVHFQFELSKEAVAKKHEQVKFLLKSPFIQNLRAKYPEIDEIFVYNHCSRLSDYCEVMKKCQNCKGLEFCRQPNKGFRMELEYDIILLDQQRACNYKIDLDNEVRFKKKFIEADIGDDYFRVDLRRIDVSKENDSYFLAYTETINLAEDCKATKGIYYSGKPGVGKTYLAAGLTNYRVKERNQKAAFVSVPKLIADLKLLFNDSLAFEQKLDRLKRADVLVLDDIGGENISSWSRDDILLPLLNKRMESHKLTIFTSNYSMEELQIRYEGGGKFNKEPIAAERLCERIRALSIECNIKGTSRRK